MGYFVERVDLRKLEELLSPPAGEPAPSFWLLDEQGRILIRDGRVMERPGREAFPAFREDAWVGEAEIPGAGRTVCGLRPLTGRFRGYLAGLVPAATAYRPVKESRNRLLAYGVPAVLGILFLNLIAARSLLRPVLLLREGARRASAGDLDVYLPVRGRDEIAELTRAFNEMARRVREGRQSLEEARDELARINEDLKVANRTLETLAITDGLTGLYNHRPFQDTLEKEIRRCDRDGRQLGLLLLDLDHFKQYNDRWGHTEGDAALRRVAGHVLKSIRSTDMAFRYGGEDLAVLLPSCTKKQAADVAEKIRMAVGRPQGRPVRFGGRTTVSIGVATFPEDGRVVRGLVDAADAALYQAKERGRNRVVAAGADSAKTETVG